jgi:prepilin-type N-terminal cleavage/methylation domain-containing protein
MSTSVDSARKLKAATGVARGFTLAEIMIVMIIMGILGSMIARGINSGPYRMDAAARVVRSAMQQAQRTAILRQYDVVVSFDSSRRRMRVFEDADNDHSLDPTELVNYRALETGSRFARPTTGVDGASGAAFIAPALSVAGLPSVVFHRDGSTNDAIVVYIADAAPGAKTFRAVGVTRSTGRVQWYRGDGLRWKAGGL